MSYCKRPNKLTFAIGLYVRIKPPVEGQPVPPAGYFALVCIYLFASFFQWGWGPGKPS